MLLHKKMDRKFWDESSYFDSQIEIFSNFNNPFQKYRIKNVLRIYTPKKNQNVLDLGCAWGTFCFVFAPLCKNVTGLDFSKKSINLCKKLLKIHKFKNIKFICADAQNTKLKSASYDVVNAADLFGHLFPNESDKVLNECNRLLRGGGKLMIWTPNRDHFLQILHNNNILLKKDISQVDCKKMNDLLQLLQKNGFLVKKSYYVESHIPILSSIERLLISRFPFMGRRIAILAEKTG